ncbi:3-oxoacyl-[acyl-carrier-protein] reductase [Eggerthia catenaformis OT 569 = DSM 20559]|uniref:3-oxoacyl-[acyl-carrier-protein] reductase n=1 Tax=Eggerthia catenaformis OT 569 = DSM 20559 TaxID=999415 RepID=M2PM02_9FIRM|nr:3-oxoacyl-[acyl-carrier-protein] reductase [Eggerthia catenaformis]EMD16579.1 3-oxoacyl-[acyl-carrier-protein] reductase [Eggerthia catenaformis OT 569 = DSM 20559]
MDLTSKIALITGGIKGIGKATALTLASKGANIVLNYRKNSNNDEIALKLQKEIESLGVQVLLAKGDISNEEDVKEIFKLIKDHFGRLDILVNNAGITRDNLIIRTKTEDFNQVIDANLKGTFLCMKYASKIMIKQKYGRIISLSSVTGIIGNPGQTNYAASKAGIIGMSKSLAKELGSRHITVNVVAPGFVETDMTKKLDQEYLENMIHHIPLERLGKPEDIAYAVAFLASDEASYITGHVLQADGGMAM